MRKEFCIGLLILIVANSVAASDGLLSATYEEVAAVLGKSSSHDKGQIAGVAYERHHYLTAGWKTSVLFIEGKAQKLETEKMDGAAFTSEDEKAILDRYDLPDTTENAKLRGWRWLADNHFIRGDGRVHVIRHGTSMNVFLDDLSRDFW